MKFTRYRIIAVLMMAISITTAAVAAPLHDAAAAGSSAKVRQLLKNGADVNAPDQNGRTALHIAAARGDSAMAALLLESGAKPDSYDSQGRTPMHEAAAANSAAVISLLAEAGASIYERDDNAVTPLFRACYLGNRDAAAMLLEYGADPNDVDTSGRTPMEAAAINGFTEVEELLLSHGAFERAIADGYDDLSLEARPDIDFDETSSPEASLFQAVRSNDYDWVHELIYRGVDVNAMEGDGTTPLHVAAINNYYEILELLVDSGANMDARIIGETPLHWAAWSGAVESIRILLQNGAAVNAVDDTGQTPLDETNGKGYDAAAALLKQYGALSGAPGYNLQDEEIFYDDTDLETSAPGNLYDAAAAGDFDAARQFIRDGADVNLLNESPVWTPLHAAAKNNNTRIAQLLIDSGADVNLQPENGWTPLHIAAYWGSRDVGSILLAAGAAPDANIAAGLNDTKMLSSYLDNGTDVNLTDRDGETLLHWAAHAGAYDTAAMLISRGADASRTSVFSNTPRDVAQSRGFNEIEELMGSLPASGAALIDTINMADEQGVRALLRSGADVNAAGLYDETPLFWAVRNNQFAIAELLINNGARINVSNSDGATPLHVAAFWAYTDLMQLLIDQGADVNAADNNGDTPMAWANDEGAKAILLQFGGANAAETIPEDIGAALIAAVMNNNIDDVRRLLNNGADMSAADANGLTALHWAAFMRHKEIAELLIAGGAAVDLFIAAGLDDVDAIKDLAAAGHNINAADFEGDTPLHWAVHADNRRAVETLLALGADPGVKNNQGLTPKQKAADMQSTSDIISAFEKPK